MSDFDRGTEKTSPGRGRSEAAFREAMTGVQTRCHQLRAAIDDHDLEGVARAGLSAADFWLAGSIAWRRLMANNPAASPYLHAAREHLEALHGKLLDLLALAATAIKVPALQRVLAPPRARLVAAMREPLGAAAEVVAARASSGTSS